MNLSKRIDKVAGRIRRNGCEKVMRGRRNNAREKLERGRSNGWQAKLRKEDKRELCAVCTFVLFVLLCCLYFCAVCTFVLFVLLPNM